MTQLPRKSQIPGLTQDNVRSVALCYLAKLKRGVRDTHALDFATAAIDHLKLQSERARNEADEHRQRIGQLLKFVPHCRVNLERNDTILTEQFIDWLDFTEMHFELMHWGTNSYYLFENEEDRILFKLRWL